MSINVRFKILSCGAAVVIDDLMYYPTRNGIMVYNGAQPTNCSDALALQGKSVVLVDADIGLRNLDVVMGLENRIVYTIVDVVEKRCKLKQALVKDKKNPNLCLLAAAQTRDKTSVSQEQLKDICEKACVAESNSNMSHSVLSVLSAELRFMFLGLTI